MNANLLKPRFPAQALIQICAILLFASSPLGVRGASNYVASISALQTAINGAANGDLIVLANGTYSNNTININKSGITVRAATPGGVFLNGTDNITISGSRVTFSGFQFINSGSNTSGIPIDVTGSQNLLTQLNFDGFSVQKYINIQAPSRSNEVAYCNFRNKPVIAQAGNLIHVEADASVAGYHKIRYCSFQDMPGAGGDNGNECIRLSNGAQSNYIARTLVEYCYFNNTGAGDSEAISIKCRANLIRYCTFTNNPNAMLVFRNGNDNVAYGNFFINAGGIRVKESNNGYIYNNYFQSSGVGGSMDAVTLDYQSVVSPENPNPIICSNIIFLHNTFVDCGDIDLGSTGPVSNTWANNIFKKSAGNIFINPNLGTSWAGNIHLGTLGISIPSGMTSTNPQLVLNSDGYYGLNSNSPAIDASSASYPAFPDVPNVDDDFALLFDISRQARPASVTFKDVGCDEFTTGSIGNRPLGLSDVGPSYLGGPGGTVAPTIVAQSSNQTVVVGAPVSFFVVASGTAPFSYQWRRNGTNLVGATAATNSIASAQLTDAGSYSVVVTNVAGSITNTPATLTVTDQLSVTNVLLDDRWRDGTRTNTSLPTDSAWYANAASSLVAVTNRLIATTDPASTLTWWTYFTTNVSSPVQLGVSDTLRLTLAFIADGVNANNTSRGLRLGVFNSANGTRTLGEGSNPNGVNVSGYMLSLNIGQTFGGSPTMQLLERTNLPSTNLIGTVNDYATLSSGGPIAGSAGLSNGVPYVLEVLVRRNAGAVDITATISNTNGWSVAQTANDTNNFTTGFDTFVFRPALSAQTVTNFTFTEFKAELLSTNNHPPVAGTHTATVKQNQFISIPVASLLATDSDPDGDALSITAVSALTMNNGAVALFGGSITYTPPIGYAGNDLFSYTLSDVRSANSMGYVAVTVVPPPVISSFNMAGAGSVFTLSGTGEANQPYVLQSTSDLTLPIVWTLIATNSAGPSGAFSFTDSQTTNYPQRFYRVVSP